LFLPNDGLITYMDIIPLLIISLTVVLITFRTKSDALNQKTP
jgi:hypothetical protein